MPFGLDDIDINFDADTIDPSAPDFDGGIVFDAPDPIKDDYELADDLPTNFSSDDELEEYKRKGYTFSKDGRIWNADGSRSVGSWDVRGYIQDELAAGKSRDDIFNSFEGGVTFDNVNGSYQPRSSRSPQIPGSTHGGRQAPPATGGGTTATTGGGGGRNSGGGGGGGSSGGGGGGGGTGIGVPNIPTGGTGITPPIGGSGPTGIDPNAPIGVNDPGAQSQSLGDFFGGSRGGLGGGNSIFDNLPDNPTIRDILGAVQRGQEGTRDAQLDIFAGLFDESLNSQESLAQRDLLNRVIANPESMDEATINRIMGQNNQAIGSRASQQAQLAQDRAASMGVGRDIGQREQGRILREGAQQQTEAERATRIDAVKTNFQDRLNTLGAAGGEISRDQGARVNIGGAAAGVHGQSQDRGDTFLTNALLTNPDTPKIAGMNQVRFNSHSPNFVQ